METKQSSRNRATQSAATCGHAGVKLGMVLLRASKDDEKRAMVPTPQARGREARAVETVSHNSFKFVKIGETHLNVLNGKHEIHERDVSVSVA